MKIVKVVKVVKVVKMVTGEGAAQQKHVRALGRVRDSGYQVFPKYWDHGDSFLFQG